MADLKVGVIVDSFRLPVREAIAKAAEVGADGIQVFAVSGDMDPDNLDTAARADLKKYIADQGLALAALCGDLGGHGFEIPADNEWKVEKSRKIMDLAVELGTSVVTTHIGVVPDDPADDAFKAMQDACNALAEYGDRVGASFAIETGPETAAQLKTFLDGLSARGVTVNFDPANFVMVTGDDPIKGVDTLKDYIVHVHAKDGVKTGDISPKKLYGFFADGGIEDLRLSDYFEEKPLGEGDVDFAGWVRALKTIGYDGYYTIEREVGDDPATDIANAVKFLRKLDA